MRKPYKESIQTQLISVTIATIILHLILITYRFIERTFIPDLANIIENLFIRTPIYALISILYVVLVIKFISRKIYIWLLGFFILFL